MANRNSNELAWWQKILTVLGVGALFAVVANVMSDGALFEFVVANVSGEQTQNEPPSAPALPYDDPEPTDDEINETMAWDCFYDPTMNDNWHDDVLCRRGTESHRPILLDGQFVTEMDMIAAGEAYEAELNG